MRRLGYDCPRVALISALEVVNPKIPDTMEAAILSKMCDRGQIKNCIVDGPLALDNAVSEEAARHKNITSPVRDMRTFWCFLIYRWQTVSLKRLFSSQNGHRRRHHGNKSTCSHDLENRYRRKQMMSIMFSIYLSGKPDVSHS